jgi:hypothetical protein
MKHGRKFGSAPPGFLADPNKQHLIEGEWHLSASGERIDSYSAATSFVLATLARGRREEGDAAVALQALVGFRGYMGSVYNWKGGGQYIEALYQKAVCTNSD